MSQISKRKHLDKIYSYNIANMSRILLSLCELFECHVDYVRI
jgi:hypothetical protein